MTLAPQLFESSVAFQVLWAEALDLRLQSKPPLYALLEVHRIYGHEKMEVFKPLTFGVVYYTAINNHDRVPLVNSEFQKNKNKQKGEYYQSNTRKEHGSSN